MYPLAATAVRYRFALGSNVILTSYTLIVLMGGLVVDSRLHFPSAAAATYV